MTPQEREPQAKRDWLVEFMQGSEASRCPATGTKIWDALLGYPIFFVSVGRKPEVQMKLLSTLWETAGFLPHFSTKVLLFLEKSATMSTLIMRRFSYEIA